MSRKAPEPAYPNPELLSPCLIPKRPAERTLGGLADYIGKALASIRECNDDKAALRAFYDELRAGQ